MRQYEEARAIWEELLRAAGSDERAAQEARQHVVTLWALSGQLEQRIAPLERRLALRPPDLEAGRLAGELYLRLRRPAQAETALRRVIAAAPGDIGSHQRLERALVLERKLSEAIVVLDALARLDPKRSRDYFQRMAQYSAELYRDDDAIRYAARAVELSPDDAEGHQKLGEMYRHRQDVERAIAQFRKAIAKNDRLYPVYFELADLLVNQGQIDEADRLLRHVMRSSPDEELVAQAARMSMQLDLGRGMLETLEHDLLPLVLGNPTRSIYRRLLVEMYGAMAFPLAQKERSGDEAERARAGAELRRIGERAVKPLLDALRDPSDSQQSVALDLLGHIRNRSAGSALLAYATGTADAPLRVRAMLALGALEDPDVLPRLEAMLAPKGVPVADEGDPVVVAGAYAVVRMRSPKARPLLRALLGSEAPSARALGAIGLGLLASKADAPALAKMVRATEQGPLARASAAFAIGAIGAAGAADALVELSESTDDALRAAAARSLARLRAPAADRAVAELLTGASPALARAGAQAALVLATGEYRLPSDPLETPEGRIEVEAVLAHLTPRGYGPDDSAHALVRLGPALERAAVSAAQSSQERALAVAEALLARGGRPAFGELTQDIERASPEARADAERTAESIARAVTKPFLALADHPSPPLRRRAAELLATRPNPEARERAVKALSDPDDGVVAATLEALSRFPSPEATGGIAALLGAAPSWSLRMRAAESLGAIGASASTTEVFGALSHAALHDASALVREAAARSLARIDPAKAREVLERAVRTDTEPRVRDAARMLLAPVR